jgi:hypothetical protein
VEHNHRERRGLRNFVFEARLLLVNWLVGLLALRCSVLVLGRLRRILGLGRVRRLRGNRLGGLLCDRLLGLSRRRRLVDPVLLVGGLRAVRLRAWLLARLLRVRRLRRWGWAWLPILMSGLLRLVSRLR